MPDFITKEQIRKNVIDSNPNLTEPEVDREAEGIFGVLYDTGEEYQERFEAHQEAINNRDTEVDDLMEIVIPDFREVEREINPEHGPEFERLKTSYIRQGLGVTEASARAEADLYNQYEDAAYISIDERLDRLIDKGYTELKSNRGRIKSILAVYGGSVLDAYQRAASEDKQKEVEMGKMSGREREFYDLLDDADRAALAGLKVAQPDASWSFEKYYHRQYGNKPRKKAPAKPPEPTIGQEKYEKEHQRYMKVRQEFIDTFGYDPDDAA